MRTRMKLIGLAAGAAGLVLAAAATAQPERTERSPLRGPQVERGERDRLTGTFGDQPANARRQSDAGGEMDVRLYMRAVMSLSRAGDDLRLTDEQSQEVRAVLRSYMQSQRTGMADRQDEIAELMKKAGIDRETAARARRGQGDAGELRRQIEEATPEQREAMQQLRAMRAEAADFGPYKEKLAAVLTSEQMKHVEVEVATLRQEGESRRRGAAGGRGGPGAGDAADPMVNQMGDPMAPGGEMGGAIKSRRLAAVLGRMTAEQQDRLAEMLERRLRAGEDSEPGEDGPRRRGRAGQGQGEAGSEGRARPGRARSGSRNAPPPRELD